MATYVRFRRNRPSTEVLDEWRMLASRAPAGTTFVELARRMGMTRDALQQVLCRARRRGDERAIYLRHPVTGVRYDLTPRGRRPLRSVRESSSTEGGQ